MVGRRRLREAGKYAGQPYQKPHKLVGNSYVVVARRAAEDIASVRRLVCSALLFACAVDFAQNSYVVVTRRAAEVLHRLTIVAIRSYCCRPPTH